MEIRNFDFSIGTFPNIKRIFSLDTLGFLRANNKWTGIILEVAIVAIAAFSEM